MLVYQESILCISNFHTIEPIKCVNNLKSLMSAVEYLLSSIRHSGGNLWAGLPIQLSSCSTGHSDEASGADEARCLSQTESVRGAVVECVTQSICIFIVSLNTF